MIGRPMILASAESVTAAATYPANRWDVGGFANEVTFIVDVQNLTGTPTTASLSVKAQLVMPHTTGNQFITERLFDMGTTQKAGLTLEGVDWRDPAETFAAPKIADQTSSFPLTVQRTYKGFGYSIRLVLTPSFSGGTSPAFVVSIVAIPKG